MLLSPARILTVDEVQRIVDRLKDEDTNRSWLNLVIFRLSACCGLRCKEIQGINVLDLKHNGDYPYLALSKEIVKGEAGKRKARSVPLWWDKATYSDLTEWQEFRLASTDNEDGPFVCGLQGAARGKRLSRCTIADHWDRTIVKVLGPDRAKCLSIHCGRHSFTSICHAAGVPLASIRDALGHSSLAVTDIYCHTSDATIRNVFGGGMR